MSVDTTKHKMSYVSLDGWRGVAILSIVIGHAVDAYSWNISDCADFFLFSITHAIDFIVDIFFFISGFLITRNLLARASFSLRDFYLRRFFRIVPLYAITVALVFIANTFLPGITYKSIIQQTIYPVQQSFTVDEIVQKGKIYILHDDRNAKYTMHFVKHPSHVEGILQTSMGAKRSIKIDHGSFNGFVEATVVGGSFGLPNASRRIQPSNRTPGESYAPYLLMIQNYTLPAGVRMLKHLWFVAVIFHFYVFYGLLFFVLHKFFSDEKIRQHVLLSVLLCLFALALYLRSSVGERLPDYYAMTHLRIDSIFFGCLVGLAEVRSATFKRVLQLPFAAPILFATGCALFALVMNISPFWHTIPPFAFTLSYIAFGLMVMSASHTARFTAFFFENKPVVFLGKYSFGIYLFHYPYLFYFMALKDFLPHMNTVISISIYILTACTIGAAAEILSGRMFPRGK